jgi:ATP-binding cassette subfamily F protein uup
VLILDEPTNDLDLGTLRLLEEALVDFKGTLITVSHDRYFLNRVCNSILAFEGNGVVSSWVGNYDYFLEKRAEQASFAEAFTKPAAVAPPVASKPRKLKWKEERELETMESTILTAEEGGGSPGGDLHRARFLFERMAPTGRRSKLISRRPVPRWLGSTPGGKNCPKSRQATELWDG